MSEEIVKALRAVFEQFARGDFSAYAALPDEFELVIAPEMPDAGTYRGEAAQRWLNSWIDSFERLTQEAVDFVDAGDRVVVEMIQRGWPRQGASKPVEIRNWALNTVRDGAIVRSELFLTRAEALEAAGLRD